MTHDNMNTSQHQVMEQYDTHDQYEYVTTSGNGTI